MVIRNNDQSWCNSFTRLLLRKKNRNYLFYKRCEVDYQNFLKQPNPSPDIVTRLLNKKDKAYEKSRQAANDSTKANRRAKISFHSAVNNTMRNPSISAKKKFSILLKLMKNNKFSTIPPLVENESTIQDPLEQSNIFNKYLSSKSTVQNPDDPAPNLTKKAFLTKIRVGRSDLNQHKFTIGLCETPQCLCHNREESPLHYFIDCFLYLPERQTLFEKIEHYIPNFLNFPKYRKQ